MTESVHWVDCFRYKNLAKSAIVCRQEFKIKILASLRTTRLI